MLKNNGLDPDSERKEPLGKISRDWFCWLIIIAALLLMRPASLTPEGVQNFSYIHSLYFDADLDFENQYKLFLEKTRWYSNQDLTSDPSTGMPINSQSIAASIMWSPLLIPAFATQQLLSANAGPHFYPSYALLISLATGLYGVLGLVLVYRMLDRISQPVAARFATLLVWTASPLLYYMHFNPGAEHTLVFALAATLLTIATRTSRGRGIMLFYGFCAGLFLIFRNGHLLLLTAFLSFEAIRWFQNRNKPIQRHLFSLTAFVVGIAFPVVIQALAWKILHGQFWPPAALGLPSNSFSLLQPTHLLNVLISPHHGLFYWHPLLLIGLVGMFVPTGQLSLKTLSMALFIATWWWTGSSTQWWAGTSFGHRFYCAVLPCFAIGATYFYSTLPRMRLVLWLFVILGTLWNMYLTFAYDQQWISQRDPVSWSEMVSPKPG